MTGGYMEGMVQKKYLETILFRAYLGVRRHQRLFTTKWFHIRQRGHVVRLQLMVKIPSVMLGCIGHQPSTNGKPI